MIKTIFLFIFFQIVLKTNQADTDVAIKECPLGWIMWKDSCYYFSKNARPWHAARAMCRSMDADARLTEIETKEESDFLEKMAFDNAYMDCYYDEIVRLLDGDFLDDAHNLTNEKCVHFCRQRGFTYAGTQYSRQCFCGDSLDKYSPRNKQECELACTGDSHETCGGHWRLSVYLTAGTPRWLGGQCVPVDKEWKWFTSKKYINGYTNWNEKHVCNKESCLDINLQGIEGYKWSDENCLRSLHFICEMAAKVKPVEPPTTTEAAVTVVNQDKHFPGCLSSCRRMLNGDYQSCNGCHYYVTCVFGSMVYRPCPRGLVWDDLAKQCLYSSHTCFKAPKLIF